MNKYKNKVQRLMSFSPIVCIDLNEELVLTCAVIYLKSSKSPLIKSEVNYVLKLQLFIH